jgi:hypothetical protein
MRISWKKSALLIALALIMAGCAKKTSATSDVTCLIMQDIKPSRSDTAETLKQISQHNAAWRALCK